MKLSRLTVLGALFCAIVVCLSGCGGILTSNSTILVHLKQNPNVSGGTAQDMTTFELYVTTGGTTPLNLANTTTWANTITNNNNVLDNYVVTRSTTEIDLQFSTRSTQVPYYIFVTAPGATGSTQIVGLSVDVDASTGAVKIFNMPTGATTQVSSTVYLAPATQPGNATINRNSAVY